MSEDVLEYKWSSVAAEARAAERQHAKDSIQQGVEEYLAEKAESKMLRFGPQGRYVSFDYSTFMNLK